jgi:ribulose-5-phosphate 4-epimerase/fuculose-1-phosphate aldolase
MNMTEELRLLRELSARLGANPLLVQASTGNTSVKVNETLWIKASGKWLAQAQQDDFLVPVDLEAARAGCCGSLSGGPCASIETSMHAVLPRRVVIHVHSVNVIAWAVRQDGERQLAERLSGLAWQWIPYSPSGLPLARRVEKVIAHTPETKVFVLGNHGLVVCGDTCPAAEALLEEVEERLRVEPRLFPCSAVNALATDPQARRILAGGVLYPCQAIFLPGTAPVLEQVVSGNHLAQQPFFLIDEQGVRVSRSMTRAEFEILNGLAEVVRRVDPVAPIRYLEEAEVRAVLGEGAGSYRQVADPDYAAAMAN